MRESVHWPQPRGHSPLLPPQLGHSPEQLIADETNIADHQLYERALFIRSSVMPACTHPLVLAQTARSLAVLLQETRFVILNAPCKTEVLVLYILGIRKSGSPFQFSLCMCFQLGHCRGS